MRNLEKGAAPQVLADNAAQWLAAYLADRTNNTNRYRYRHRDIKAALTGETHFKCAYCESKIGHNTPGDIEHKVPTSVHEELHFEWMNLTTACTECNRRKRDYYAVGAEFIDPYADDVETLIEHHGPIVGWRAGHARAEISVRMLQFGHPSRNQLVLRKIEQIDAFYETLERYTAESDPTHRQLHLIRLREFCATDAEYSAMMLTIARQKGVPV